MTPSSDSSARRKNATRACDTCKTRKVKCDGQRPCSRCVREEKGCSYRLPYYRNQSGLPAHLYHSRSCRCSSGVVDGVAEGQPAFRAPDKSDKSPHTSQVRDAFALDSTPEVAGDYTGDASVNGFLRKVSSHLARIGQGLPRNLFKRHEEDDQGRLEGYIQTLVLPEKSVAYSCLKAYFVHGNATCRFLPREPTFELLEQLYQNDLELARNHPKYATILLALGTGLVWNASWKNEPLSTWRARALPFLQVATERLRNVDRCYPPTTEALQAQLLRCQCELVLGRFNSAWMSLGWAIRQGQMVDVQKEQYAGNTDPLDAFYRRRFFWAMFMMDRYLAIILGRPMGIQEIDVKVALSPHLEDAVAPHVDAAERKLLMGTVVHYELVKIIGRAATQLYPVRNREQKLTDDIVTDLEGQLQNWSQNTPKFFQPDNEPPQREEDQYYNIPWILKRQQRTVRGAFYFAKMLIYRSYLLQAFHSQDPETMAADPLPPRAILCTDYALSMVDLAGEFGIQEGRYNGTFWFTSHFVFSAISILLVYLTLCQDPDRRASVEKVVDHAMAFHRKLDNSIHISAQKLLEESRSRANAIQTLRTPGSSASMPESRSQNHLPADEQPAQSSAPSAEAWASQWGVSTASQDNNATFLDMIGDMEETPMFSAGTGASNQDLDMIMDIGFDSTWYSGIDYSLG